MYRIGFRALEEVAEASEQELGSLEGLGGPANAASLRKRAAEAMERLRQKRVDEAASGNKPLSERDELLLIRGVTARVSDLLQHAGYKGARDIRAEEDIDRLAIRTGLGSKKAQELRDAVLAYQEQDLERVDEGQRKARERQAEADAKARAESAARMAEADARANESRAAAAAQAQAASDAGDKAVRAPSEGEGG